MGHSEIAESLQQNLKDKDHPLVRKVKIVVVNRVDWSTAPLSLVRFTLVGIFLMRRFCIKDFGSAHWRTLEVFGNDLSRCKSFL